MLRNPEKQEFKYIKRINRRSRIKVVSSEKWVLSYGGGVNTTALMIYLIKKGLSLNEAVFADVGGEMPETYSYLKIAKKYLADHGVRLRVIKVSVGGTGLYECAYRRKSCSFTIMEMVYPGLQSKANIPILQVARKVCEPISYLIFSYDFWVNEFD